MISWNISISKPVQSTGSCMSLQYTAGDHSDTHTVIFCLPGKKGMFLGFEAGATATPPCAPAPSTRHARKLRKTHDRVMARQQVGALFLKGLQIYRIIFCVSNTIEENIIAKAVSFARQ